MSLLRAVVDGAPVNAVFVITGWLIVALVGCASQGGGSKREGEDSERTALGRFPTPRAQEHLAQEALADSDAGYHLVSSFLGRVEGLEPRVGWGGRLPALLDTSSDWILVIRVLDSKDADSVGGVGEQLVFGLHSPTQTFAGVLESGQSAVAAVVGQTYRFGIYESAEGKAPRSRCLCVVRPSRARTREYRVDR